MCLLVGWLGIRMLYGIEQWVKKNGFYKWVLEMIEIKKKIFEFQIQYLLKMKI